MPRFYFNVEGSISSEDFMGVDLTDETEVQAHAQRCRRRILSYAVQSGWSTETWRIVVEDSHGAVVVQMPVSPAAIPN